MSEIAFIKGGVTYYTDGLASQVCPTLLRRAIESVGIEKPSDYTLVLEEVERLMAAEHEPLVTISPELEAVIPLLKPSATGSGHLVIKNFDLHQRYAALIRAATDLVKEAEEMGWDKRSETGLPGAWDKFKLELERVTK